MSHELPSITVAIQESFSNSSPLIELTMPPLCSSSCLTVLISVSPTGLKFLEGRCQVLTLYVWPQSWCSKYNRFLILFFFLWKETIKWVDTRNTLFQVCDLEVGTERGGGNHRFLGCCKLHPIHQGPSFVGRPKKSYFYFFIFFYFYFLLCWVFVSVRGLSLVAASGGHSSSRCAGLSLSRPLLLRSTGSRHAGSVVVAQGPSCSVACGIFPDQGSNPCPLHWQADSQPLRHHGSPEIILFNEIFQ